MLLSLALMLGLSTAALLCGLAVTTEEGDFGSGTIVKCVGINVVVCLLSFIPYGGILSMFVWLAAVMLVFEKTFVEAIVISLVSGLVTFIGSFLLLGLLMGLLS